MAVLLRAQATWRNAARPPRSSLVVQSRPCQASLSVRCPAAVRSAVLRAAGSRRPAHCGRGDSGTESEPCSRGRAGGRRSMEFRVLGPLEVVVDGQPRNLPRGAEQAVLALLLLNPGRVVAAETLVDALWGDSLPVNPANALQLRVSKLRRALGAAAQPEATRLEELRLAATEERVELELAAGRHADLVGELEALVARHPLRERLHAQLMLALYRSGRQADALAAYQRARAALNEELGLDPSAELRELERAILGQDPELGAPLRQRTVAPSNLPARLTSFIGRGRQLEQVAELVGEHRLVTLTGPGGVGKTSLAIEVASRLTRDYADGVWLVNLAGVRDATRVATAVADALGAPDGTATAQEHLLRYLRGRAALVVLDNCEHLADACAALVERLLVSCTGLRLLTTSREPLGVPGEAQVAIPPLDTPPL